MLLEQPSTEAELLRVREEDALSLWLLLPQAELQALLLREAELEGDREEELLAQPQAELLADAH